MMRIGIICYPSVGGSGFLATKLGLELAKRGHEVHFFSYETPHLLQTGHLHSVQVHIVDVTSYALFKFPPYTLSLTSKLIEESGKLDILNVHYAIPHAASAFLAKTQTHLPFVVTLHGSDVHTVGPHPAYRHSVSVTLKQADALTTVAQFLADEAKRNFDISDVSVIPNFVDAKQFTRSAYKNECCIIAPSDYNILHVSNFRSVKRTTDLIKAMSIVK
ncbi:MAG: glycosyltransferase, partial [Candidatus Hodarchaeota archaeon]